MNQLPYPPTPHTVRPLLAPLSSLQTVKSVRSQTRLVFSIQHHQSTHPNTLNSGRNAVLLFSRALLQIHNDRIPARGQVYQSTDLLKGSCVSGKMNPGFDVSCADGLMLIHPNPRHHHQKFLRMCLTPASCRHIERALYQVVRSCRTDKRTVITYGQVVHPIHLSPPRRPYQTQDAHQRFLLAHHACQQREQVIAHAIALKLLLYIR